MHVYLRALAVLAVALSLGCAAEDFGADDFDGDGGGWGGSSGNGGQMDPGDSGPGAPDGDPVGDGGRPCDHILTPMGCLETMTDVCDYVAQLDGCVDRDGDCFVSECNGVDAALYLPVMDCGGDADPDVHPLAAEVCDGKDNNCKDGIDENFPRLGSPCEVCGGEGKILCDIDDPTRAVCRLTGDGDGPVELAREECNEVDDDCDGVVDELCAVRGLPDVQRNSPVLCGDALVYVEGYDIVSVQRGRPTAVIHRDGQSAEGDSTRPVHLDCNGDLLAWLELRSGGECVADELGNERCVSSVWVADLTRAGDPREVDTTWLIAPDNSFGPPVVGDGVVYHAAHILEAQSVIRRVDPNDLGSPYTISNDDYTLVDPAVLPPTEEGAARIAVRRLDENVESNDHSVMVLTLNPGMNLERVVGSSPSTPGPPAGSDNWLVWSMGAVTPALWAVPLSTLRNGFQPVNLPGPQADPKLDGDIMVWLDGGTVPPTLRWMHLLTGSTRTIARAYIDPGDFDAADGVVVWVEQTEMGSVVMVDGQLPGPPPDRPTPDAGMPDGGATDGSIDPPPPGDGGVDATLSDGGIAPADGAMDLDGSPAQPVDAGPPNAP